MGNDPFHLPGGDILKKMLGGTPEAPNEFPMLKPHPTNPPPRAENIDIIQVKAMRFSEAFNRTP